MSTLLDPFTIKHIRFRNRVVMPPMVRMAPGMPPEVADTRGEVSDAVVAHYRQRAAAGVGLIIVEATAVDPGGRAWPQGLLAYADEHIPDLARLASAIRAEGCVAGIQLVHGGPQSSPSVVGGQTVGPSAVPPSEGAPVPRALSVDEIRAIEGRFADAAARVVEAGYEVVELHGAHGYLLDSFLSKRRNQRDDVYGGDLRGRMRFLIETLQQARARIGDRALLDCRISFFNKLDESFAAADLIELIMGMQDCGLDLLHLSTRGGLNPCFGSDKTAGQWAREVTNLPIIVAGGLGNPADARRLIAEGHADFAAVGSALLADPGWVGGLGG
jgi:2,4-dienoyl-CoA reductase-like NADH-dependent reductase (Old Yellow Enzyme family)